MYRISITSLEQFRRYVSGTSPFDTEERLLETLAGKFEGNEYTRIGTAFHSIVEQGEAAFTAYGDGMCVPVDGYEVYMNIEQVITALRYRFELAGATFEVPIGKDYLEGRFPIHVTGRIDTIHGMDTRDTKTKYSHSDASDYINSYQWRFYLDITKGDRFYFDVFEFEKYNREKNGLDVRGLKLIRTDPIECLRYNDMERDNRQLLDEFREYIHNRNLFHLLKIKE